MEKKIIYTGDGSVGLIDKDHRVSDRLEPRFYQIKVTEDMMRSVTQMTTDDNVVIPTSAEEIARNYIDFPYVEKYFSWDSRNIHKALNVKLKLGFLLSGRQGTGKTTAAYALAKYFIDNYNAVAVTVKDIREFDSALKFLADAKKIEDFVSVIIFDECEAAMENAEDYMKRTLDSSNSLSDTIFMFTTNYETRIPDTIKKRPSRIKFHTVMDGIRDESVIFEIVCRMNSSIDERYRLKDKDLRDLTANLKGCTIDEVKNNFVDEVFHINMKSIGLDGDHAKDKKKYPKKDLKAAWPNFDFKNPFGYGDSYS